MSHTPGPWLYDAPQIDSEHYVVAEAKAMSLATRNADARLIAAAPDLLEALKGLVEAADQDWPHAPKCDPAESPCCCEVIEIGRATQKARAAIAKAEGEE